MISTLTIPTTSTVMRGEECVLQLDVGVEVECDEGFPDRIIAFYIGDDPRAASVITARNDPHLFALLSEGIDQEDLAERAQVFHDWEPDHGTGSYLCKGLAP